MGTINVIHPAATGSVPTRTSFPFPSKRPPQAPAAAQFSLPRPTPPATVHELFSSLRLSASRSRVDLARAAHAVFLKLFHDNTLLGTSVISTYLELGRLQDARHVFDGLPAPNVVSYSVLISEFAKSGLEDEAVELFERMRSSGIEPDGYSFVAVLTACMRLLDKELGSQFHGLCLKLGCGESVFVCNALMGLYGKCGCLNYVVKVFDEMPQRDVTSWNKLISSFVQGDCLEKGLEAFREMGGVRGSGIGVDQITLSTGLIACSGCCAVMLGREIHARAIRTGLDTALSVGNDLIGFYMNFGSLREAEAVFERMKMRNVVTWTKMLNGYMEFGMTDEAVELFDRMPERNCISYGSLLMGLCQNGRASKVLDLFLEMIVDGRELTGFILTSVLKACRMVGQLELSRQVHGFVTKSGIGPNEHIGAALVDMCTGCGRMMDAEKLLKSWPFEQAGCIIRTSILCGYARNGLPDEAISFFIRCCLDETLVMDEVALASVLRVCGTLGQLELSRQVHGFVTKSGIGPNERIGAALIDMCTRCGRIMDAEKLLKSWPFEQAGSIIRTSILRGYRNGLPDEAISCFIRCCLDGTLVVDEVALTSVLRGCGILGQLELSRQVHGFVTKSGVGPNVYIGAALIDMCTRCGRMTDAEKLVKSWPFEQAGSIIRTSILCGYARNGLPDEAISFFIRCYLDGTLVVDEVALASVLGVCGTLGIDKLGMQIHSLAFKTGYAADVGVGNSLVSMYAKSCCMEKAITSFDAMPKRDIVSWNCLIAGHVLHRQGDEALSIWSNMKSAGIKPDSITFVLILSSYRHTSSNLVDHCWNLFDSMKRLHGVDPNSEHYVSLVGVLGFWGLLKEAEEIIIGMPFEPDAAVWRALLDCCRLHMDMVMGKRIVKRILALKPKDPPTYVLVSNLYSASGLWHMSDMTRENMKEKRLQKQPCRSWIFNHDNVHSFYVRDKSHPETRDIYGGLDVLIIECLKAGYQPDTSFVLHELEEHQKKDFLFYHSAKLAATYGLLSTKPGETIRIVKNILLCGDCHSFLKYVSRVTRREIVVRDTSGFHHFSDGKCSCRDHR